MGERERTRTSRFLGLTPDLKKGGFPLDTGAPFLCNDAVAQTAYSTVFRLTSKY